MEEFGAGREVAPVSGDEAIRDSNDVPAREQGFGQVRADEARAAGDEI